ncbi:ATP-binding protein [Paenibacillus sp. J5C_2022]|uniref:sensor histidine kinase n=1 Tax=Paenibacillus sp. J5C2022 TaxID=2977129 RepID=UPI0021D1E5B3|nr:ATP-binding protein [Paenibacillus sp. J5C2022]MCU6710211.1 ATP-binding protein [Paenibacillus sp. J5C2022]
MKLRTYLLLANCISIACIMILLLVFFQYMLVTKEQLLWLSGATIGAGILSAGLHFLLVRPLEASVRRVKEGASRIADGELKTRIESAGLAEFKALAGQFNAMGASLERSFEQVKEAERSQRELVANIAHDLRTPLASLQSYAEALEDGIIRDEVTLQRYVATIRSESIRLGELIGDVFELSTLDTGGRGGATSRGEGGEESSVLEDVLIELLPRFTLQLNEKALQLRVKLPEREKAVAVAMPSRHLLRILQNLIENAIRYSPGGGIIEIVACEGASSPSILQAEDGAEGPGKAAWRMIRIEVTDEGAGVPAEERERIFQRFYRSDRSRSRDKGGGSGLGLSIAKLLVEQHGGAIGAEGRSSGQGSCFWFTVNEA